MREAKQNRLQATQLELPIARERTPDRNADKGGRSFYFFDFDDNVAFLSTPVFLFHKDTGDEVAISSGDYARAQNAIGAFGPFADFRVRLCDETGTFRRFRDRDRASIERAVSAPREAFIEDLAEALGYPDFHWKGPSWSCFLHAAINQRPTALITARGHRPETIGEGIDLLVSRGHLPAAPNFLAIYPVSNRGVRAELGDVDFKLTVAELKKAAIRAAVERAVALYGANPHHRFGMSDDDPMNIALIAQAMAEMKARYPAMSFFVIETQHAKIVKWEVYADRIEATLCAPAGMFDAVEQLAFGLS